MAMNIIQKILGSANDRLIKSYDKTVSLINDLEPKYHAMSDDELRAQTDVLRARIANGEKEKNILPDAFAAVREASIRTIGLRHLFWYQIGDKLKKFVYFCVVKQERNSIMVVVSSREFRTNMMTYFTESNGDDFIVKTRDHGSFKVSIKPVKRDDAILNIPPEYRRDPYEISPSGDPFFADQRNIDMIEERLKKEKNGEVQLHEMLPDESFDDFLTRIEHEL